MVLATGDAAVEVLCDDLEKTSGTPFRAKQRLAQSMNLWLLSFDPEYLNTNDALLYAERHESVTIAQLNHANLSYRSTPNDSLFEEQWSLYNDGSNGGSGTADISAREAWDITTGGLTQLGEEIVVAVVDGGFDIDHEDLVDNIFTNEDEIPGNGVDDDNNGYIDDVHGWNAYSNTHLHPEDSHGTHVSGTIGAKGNNTTGVTGVNWDVKLLPVSGSSTIESTVVAAYGYVLDMRRLYNQTGGAFGAYIVASNSSFGKDNAQPEDFPLWCAMYDSLGYEGVLSVAATINSSVNVDEVGDVPTACSSDYLIAVTNTTSSDFIHVNAGYGPEHIDIAAPGTAIHSTINNNYYGDNWGTSMATPHVAGAVALMYSAICGKRLEAYQYQPADLALQVRQDLLVRGVDKLESLEGLIASEGRLNLYKAVSRVADTCLIVSITGTSSTCGICDGTVTADVDGAVGTIQYIWSNSTDTTNQQTGLCPGMYYVTVVDESGDSATAYYALSDDGGPVLSIDLEQPVCAGGTDGSIDVSGGFNYEWSDGGSAGTRSGLAAGVYVISATDSLGNCTTVTAIELPEPSPLIGIYSYALPTTPGDSSGTLSVAMHGGTPPYSYAWSTGDTGTSIQNVPDGMYSITVTDDVGCVYTDSPWLGFPVGLSDDSQNGDLILYPNPATGQLNFIAQGGVQAHRIYDTQGRLIQQGQHAPVKRGSIDISRIAPGMYILKLETTDSSQTQAFQVVR